MDVAGKVVVVTGGAKGIGRALVEAFVAAGARAVVAADLDGAGADATASSTGATAFACDVSRESDIRRLVDETERQFGQIDLFCSNAGIGTFRDDPLNVAAAPDAEWTRTFAVNVMAHVWAARTLVPRMIDRGGGYFLHTVSAAGLLNQIGGVVYGTTKHAAVGFAENLAIAHRDQGIRVSILCPQGVDTDMIRGAGPGAQNIDGVITAEACAAAALAGVRDERFCIWPHPEVATYVRRKADDYDRWISGMAKLRRKLENGAA